jgi:hypothetical protein
MWIRKTLALCGTPHHWPTNYLDKLWRSDAGFLSKQKCNIIPLPYFIFSSYRPSQISRWKILKVTLFSTDSSNTKKIDLARWCRA